jgi:hypothetical protein
MDIKNPVYVASCVFTREEPELSVKIQNYLTDRFKIPMMRCCVPNYKDDEFTQAMPEWLRADWKSLPQYIELTADDSMVYVCHNCAAIFEETMPQITRISLWEFILRDKEFHFPDYSREKITVQDCWRSFDNRAEQDAVRLLLQKMNIDVVETEENYGRTQFCGISTYMPAPSRNLKLAPKRFVENARGKFIPRTEDEQKKLMEEYCEKITTEKVASYCHYCVKGLRLGGKNAVHLGELLFDRVPRGF